MKNYFVYFSYRKLLPASQELGEKLMTFEIISLDNSPKGTVHFATDTSKSGVLLALSEKGYTQEVEVLAMNVL